MNEKTGSELALEEQFMVVVNHEEQYSIWNADRPMPNGWRSDGMSGTQAECLAHIDKVWTDMRPLSLRNHAELNQESEHG